MTVMPDQIPGPTEQPAGAAIDRERRALLAGGLLAGAALAAQVLRPRRPRILLPAGRSVAQFLPERVGRWRHDGDSGFVLPATPIEKEAPARPSRYYDEVVTHRYSAPDALPVMLLVAYNSVQGGLLQIHSPEACYPAAGYEVRGRGRLELPRGGAEAEDPPLSIRYLLTSNALRNEQLLYWTRVGSDMPGNWAEQHIDVAKQNLTGFVPDGLLVRLSTNAADDPTALRTLSRFFHALWPALSPGGRRLFFGAADARSGAPGSSQSG